MCRDLYFCGEVLDLDALTGGFNLQIAWSTGHLAAVCNFTGNSNRLIKMREKNTWDIILQSMDRQEPEKAQSQKTGKELGLCMWIPVQCTVRWHIIFDKRHCSR